MIKRAQIPQEIGRYALLGVALLYVLLLVGLPLVTVFIKAFSNGIGGYVRPLLEPYALAAMRLTLLVAAITVPMNVIFGLAAGWALTKFEFRGKNLLLTAIDLPFSVSPVIAGLAFVLVYGSRSGWFGPWLSAHGIEIIFAVPGIILTTSFVTLPYVARELILVMQMQGQDEEQNALALGANGWQLFTAITLPNVRWGLLYGVLLCNARAMGEFGAVSVVSGHIRGLTDTVPLHIENLHDEARTVAAFAAASVLAMLALVTLLIKTVLERRHPELRSGTSRQP